ncbi:MAG TPA: magnesium/cobalt transporter CorA [Candidatus Polarisedimenticolia bacterium]|nr:magnesium/cobalt transporter CorA [Candidatus Polarisedimenticolia bacterium]
MLTIVGYDAAGGMTENVPLDRVPALLKAAGHVLWVDLTAPTKEESGILSGLFGFHPHALEDCESRRHHPKIDDYRDYLFILTHGVHPESSMREFRTRQLSLFVGPNYLVSYHRETSRSVEYALDSARRNPRVLADGTDAILYNILDYQVDLYLPVMDNFQKKIDEIEERVFTRPTSEILREVLDLKKALMRLRRIAGHQRDIMARLTRREFAMIDEKSVINLRDVYDHLVRVTDLADSYRELVAGALEAHLSVVSNRLNEIMRALTVIATLFIPLTFIAGVYGMNFDVMPELRWRYGYLFALGLMAAVGGGMYLFFRKRGIFPGRDR